MTTFPTITLTPAEHAALGEAVQHEHYELREAIHNVERPTTAELDRFAVRFQRIAQISRYLDDGAELVIDSRELLDVARSYMAWRQESMRDDNRELAHLIAGHVEHCHDGKTLKESENAVRARLTPQRDEVAALVEVCTKAARCFLRLDDSDSYLIEFLLAGLALDIGLSPVGDPAETLAKLDHEDVSSRLRRLSAALEVGVLRLDADIVAAAAADLEHFTAQRDDEDVHPDDRANAAASVTTIETILQAAGWSP